MFKHLTPNPKKNQMKKNLSVAIAVALMAATVPGLPRKAEARLGMYPDNAVISLENVTNSPEEFFGRMVTIRGNFNESVDENTFKLSRGGFLFFGASEILVVNDSGQPFVPPENSNVPLQVTGEVRQLRVAELQRDFGWDFWNPDVYVQYNERPVIVAQSIALAPDPGQIADNPEAFYGQSIAVEGNLNEYFTGNAILLQQSRLIGGGDILVLLSPDAPRINAGDDIVVTGEVRPFILAEVERDLDIRGWNPEIRELLTQEFENRPVMFADNVYQLGNPE
jgi:hypothetical protein